MRDIFICKECEEETLEATKTGNETRIYCPKCDTKEVEA